MKRRLILFVVAGLIACRTAQAQLANPGFEAFDITADNAANWTEFAILGSSSRRTEMPRSGAAHMTLACCGHGASGAAGVSQNLSRSISPGVHVTLTGWHKSIGVPFNSTATLEWLGTPNPPPLSVPLGPFGSSYEQFSISGVAPPGTTGLVVTYGISGLGTVFIDDFDVRIIPEPACVTLLCLAGVTTVGIRRGRKRYR